MGNPIPRVKMIETALSKWGAPYKFGAKWDLKDPSPKGPIDCSGFTRWCYAQIGIIIPEGSTNQHQTSVKLPNDTLPAFGDLVFLQDLKKNQNLQDPGAEDHHTGLVYDKWFIIEARGHLIDNNGNDIGWRVLLRPRSEWEARPDWLGYFRPKSVVAIEGA